MQIRIRQIEFESCEGSIVISRERGAREGEVDREAKSEGSMTSLGRIYIPSLSGDSSETDLDADSLRTDSTDSNPNSLSSYKDGNISRTRRMRF